VDLASSEVQAGILLILFHRFEKLDPFNGISLKSVLIYQRKSFTEHWFNFYRREKDVSCCQMA